MLGLLGRRYMSTKLHGIPENIKQLVGRDLHNQQDHPLQLMKQRVYNWFEREQGGRFVCEDALSPYVTTRQNFDELLIPAEHVSRRPSDTYYVDATTVLRTHTSAHQTQLLRAGHSAFLATGQCFRRDSVDASHYPVFHQMEGVKLFAPGTDTAAAGDDLKAVLTGLARHLFGADAKLRWAADYFPFTEPSWELEVEFNGAWLEVLGCGVVHRQLLAACQPQVAPDSSGWAFGFGLERLAMVMFAIPDIRLFWSNDERFLKQFRGLDPDSSVLPKFVPFSAFPHTQRDVSFWLPEGHSEANPLYSENDFYDVIRTIVGDLAEEVSLIDRFVHPATHRTAHCYRIVYRSMTRSLIAEEINDIQDRIRHAVTNQLHGTLR